MSFPALTWAIDIANTGDSASITLVLIILANCHNDETGQCFPSSSHICRKSRLSPRTVQYALSWLQEHGLIRIMPRFDANGRQRSNFYELMMPAKAVAKAAERGSDHCNDTPRPLRPFNLELETGIGSKKEKQESPSLRACARGDSLMQKSKQELSPTIKNTEKDARAENQKTTVRDEEPIRVDKGLAGAQANGASAWPGARGPGTSSARPSNQTNGHGGMKIVPNFVPTVADLQWATDQLGDKKTTEVELEKFRSHYLAKCGTSHDWDATWRVWVLRAVDFRKERQEDRDAAKKARAEATANRIAKQCGGLEGKERLVDGWKPSDEVQQWSLKELRLCKEDIREQHKAFHDHYKVCTGADALSADWSANWRVWMRKFQRWRAMNPRTTNICS